MHTVYLAALAVASTMIVFGMRHLAGPDGSSETQKLEWVHHADELRKISENSPYMRNER